VSGPAVAPLTDFIAGLAAADQFAGAVLIAKDGVSVYMAAYGLASRSPDVPNQTDTRFNLGSMDKMFTAVAIMQLVEQGRLSLDGRIVDYWPDYPNPEVARKVTIHHLLVHASGMGDCFEGDFFTTPKDQLRTVEGYLPLFVDDPLQFEPGTQFAYSNEGYIVLGLIIEKVTGQSYDDYVRENVYGPSGMSHTGAYELDAEVPNRAIGYTTQDAQGNETGVLADNTPLMPIKGTPAGGGYSTVQDLLSFSNALLGYRLLRPESTELLLAGKIEIREGHRYAYGFFDETIGGQRVVGHGGGAPGVCTSMDMFLDSGYTVIVLSNTDQGCFPVLQFLGEHPFAPQPTATPPLRFDSLLNGFDFDGPVDEAALTPPEGAAPPANLFEGRLELLGEKDGGQIQVLRGELEPEHAYLPEFDFAFVGGDGYLIPVRRGLIVGDHPQWNIHLEPGRAWQEAGDGGFSRASLPFALTVKGGNATLNGTLTFLFDDQRVSKVWYQVTQETTTYTRANLWGLLDAVYHPGSVVGADQIRADFAAELAARLPVKPIQALAEDYPGVDVSAFGRGVSPEHMTWYGVVVNGVNYLGGCQTRFGIYPYCESMRATSYSTAKSAFVSVALMRLAQQYGPEVSSLLVKDYVPEYAASSGDWEQVTFNHVIDMSNGNYASAGYMADEDGVKMGEFFGAQPYAARIAAAFDWPHAAEPGTRWVYRTGDTFILTRALHNYLQSQQGPESDIFRFVVDEVYRPLGLGPGAYTTMRTADDDWQGQPEGGYGLWWIPDDIAKIATLLNPDGGRIGGVQVLHPGLLATALQRDPGDRGVEIDSRRMYNNAFWAERYTPADGFDCEFWVPQMLGVSGNVVALMPNGITYYYFSDNQEFTWKAAVRESDKIRPLCQSMPTP
jgi:CubicO group peptidase (beta-lactamase class C family)